MLNSLYAQIARARRRAYQRADRQRHLRRPVVSVGNLRVGGSGKTPTVACIARTLVDLGERPSILSRGYARRHAPDGVVVVSDGHRIYADLDASGDEPLMLARALEGVPVLVAQDRYLAGVVAEQHLGATVHVLDDGFQHLPLARDVDLLIVSEDDLADPRTLPGGRLREPLSAAAAADAVLVPGVSPDAAQPIGARLGVAATFGITRVAEEPRRLDVLSAAVRASRNIPVYAVAGIARPEWFFQDLSGDGWSLVGTLAFADHHRYDVRDIARIVRAAKSAGAAALVTTEKDLMRLLPFRPLALPVIWVPLTVRIEPEHRFRSWLSAKLADARHEPGTRRSTDSAAESRI
ncbi:MAG: tetraacyldisaccharide 4'-kinase [Acidobacteria bacterium]|nr:tetraacyldisaccharide 4'-kinase [Acidobacteriota bacterium]